MDFKALNARAEVTLDPTRPLKFYLRSAALLLQQAKVYTQEKDVENAYIMYMKYSNLGIGELPKHPEYTSPIHAKDIKHLKHECLKAMEMLDKLKVYLKKQHEMRIASSTKMVGVGAGAVGSTKVATRDVGAGRVEVGGRVDEDWWRAKEAAAGSGQIPTGVGGTYQSHVETQAYPTLNPNTRTEIPIASSSILKPVQTYVPHTSSSYISPPQFHPTGPTPPLPLKPPAIPSKPQNYLQPSLEYTRNDAPPIPSKAPGVAASQGHSQAPPNIPRKPPNAAKVLTSDWSDKIKARTEDGTRLRPLYLPRDLSTRFLSVAQPNTTRNLETCGILAGVLRADALIVTTLIIPKQKATSDTCMTEDEEALFGAMEEREVLALGWVHTHPTQSCFMSSVDLHTHCSYQMMLPEAIAIVLAPRSTPNIGIFRLTDPMGVNLIANCDGGLGFHPHPDLPNDMPIYRNAEAESGGHVSLMEGVGDLTVVDLR